MVDIAGTFIVGILITFLYSFILSYNGVPQEVIDAQLEDSDIFSVFSLTFIIVGCLITLYSGYLCASIVNYSEYFFVTIYVSLIIFIGYALSYLLEFDSSSLLEDIVLDVITVLSAYAGAAMHVRNKKVHLITESA